MTIRTFPIRVGHVMKDADGVAPPVVLGHSGPCYPDQHELQWEEIGVEPELTTVTKRKRRVFTFSELQLRKATNTIRPDHVFLNFANYCDPNVVRAILDMVQIANLQECTGKQPEKWIGNGPGIRDVMSMDTWVQLMYGENGGTA